MSSILVAKDEVLDKCGLENPIVAYTSMLCLRLAKNNDHAQKQIGNCIAI